MSVVGYARVSTADQDPALQLDALAAAGCDRIFTENASGCAENAKGAKVERPELAACLDYLRAGDTLVIWRLDRLGRSLRQLLDVVDQLQTREIELRSLTDGIDTTTPAGTLTFHVFGAIAEFERSLISERTRAGLQAARRRGAELGRQRVVTPAKLVSALALQAEGMSVREIADEIGVSKTALYEALRAENHLPLGPSAEELPDVDGDGLNDIQLDGLACIICGRGDERTLQPAGFGPRGQVFRHANCAGG